MPAEQVAPAAQALPHAPQFCESVASSVVWASPTLDAWPSDTVTGSGAAVVGWPAWVASTLYVPDSTCEIANAPSAPVIARNDVPGANTKVPVKSRGVQETSRPSMLPPFGPAGPCAPVAPCGPVAPTGPCGPVGPTRPCGPVGPTTPCGPVGPAAPGTPAGPVGPTIDQCTAVSVLRQASLGPTMRTCWLDFCTQAWITAGSPPSPAAGRGARRATPSVAQRTPVRPQHGVMRVMSGSSEGIGMSGDA